MLPPIFYHYFRVALPYSRTLVLQEKLHAIQLVQRKKGLHKDILLLLQHRPVYTAGRRQTEDSVHDERTRLTTIGADFVSTNRGGELTYHGPGQIVGYPLLDLGRSTPPMGIRDYICRLQRTIERHLLEAHSIRSVPSDHTGVFLDQHAKIGSIGVQVRHRLTTHGFAFNVTQEPIDWFEQVVACGLADVKATCIETVLNRHLEVEDEIPGLVKRFGAEFEREMVRLDSGQLREEISAFESQL